MKFIDEVMVPRIAIELKKYWFQLIMTLLLIRINKIIDTYNGPTFVCLENSVGRRPSLAGPNAAKIRRPLWRPDRRPKIWTAELAGQIIDGRPNVRPILIRAATLAAKFLDRIKNRSKIYGRKKKNKQNIAESGITLCQSFNVKSDKAKAFPYFLSIRY
ncbi:hypothetical protein BpHYR1_006327 [Brachionus plicatilis]|uniref:Uncharacterized protein n=1 Tax=Brachionus plicatilis TaxID=10195 RepID=A0A3M7QJC2_BRAPC|nr:hypothetical protein BpHYR1_006327 [Brachionus plicatilis]